MTNDESRARALGIIRELERKRDRYASMAAGCPSGSAGEVAAFCAADAFEQSRQLLLSMAGVTPEDAPARTVFAVLPVKRWSSRYYRNRFYWLRKVTQRRLDGEWKALEADN